VSTAGGAWQQAYHQRSLDSATLVGDMFSLYDRLGGADEKRWVARMKKVRRNPLYLSVGVSFEKAGFSNAERAGGGSTLQQLGAKFGRRGP
jgi:hypothetical protein